MGGAQEFNNSWMEGDSSSVLTDKEKEFDDGNIDFEEKIVSKEIIGKSSIDASYNWEEESSNSQDSNFDARKERLVIKFRKISEKYYMVEDIPLPSDSPFKYFNYKSVRYSFPTCFSYSTPPKKNNNPKIIRCKTCRKVFSKASTLKIHRRTHAAFAPGPYTPKDFAKRFSTASVSREPYKPAAHLKLLENVSPHPREYSGYFESGGPLPYIKPGSKLQLYGDTFSVSDMIGEGGFAKVFSAVWENGPAEERSTVLKVQMPANDWEWYILNQVKTRFDSLEHPLKEKGGSDGWKGGFMSSPRCYTYRDGAVIISQLQKMGTLLDLVNLTKNADKSIIEPIAIFLTAELLGLMELLHSVNIVHADLKPDNFLVRHIPSTQTSPSLQLIDFGKAIDLHLEGENAKPNVQKDGAVNGELNGGVDARKKLDYSEVSDDQNDGAKTDGTKCNAQGDGEKKEENEMSDLSNKGDSLTNGINHENSVGAAASAGTVTTNSNEAVDKQKQEGETVKEGTETKVQDDDKSKQTTGRTGKYHLDYFGIAGAAYCLLFGKYIEVGTVKNRWVVKGSFKRWWQVKTWEKFFDDMLNPRGEDKECLPSLLEWREKFMALFETEDLREGLIKARQIIEVKLLEKWRRNL